MDLSLGQLGDWVNSYSDNSVADSTVWDKTKVIGGYVLVAVVIWLVVQGGKNK